MVEKVVRQRDGVVMVRTAFGQVAEYDVYRMVDGKRVFVGGGTKKQATRVFYKAVK